jgi:hypothetical protein
MAIAPELPVMMCRNSDAASTKRSEKSFIFYMLGLQRTCVSKSGVGHLSLVGGDQRFGFIEAMAALRLAAECFIGLTRAATAALACSIDHVTITKPVANADEHRRTFQMELLLRTVIAHFLG